MEKKNLLTIDLQLFADEVDSGETDVETVAESQSEEETTEAEGTETVEENGNDEPQEQSAEDNARYAAMRRRAEAEAQKKYQAELNQRNQQIAAMCQGITHPITGQPITSVDDYIDALRIQQRQANEQELQEKGVDPALIDRMIASNPVVMQAQQVIEQSKMVSAENALQKDIAEIMKYDPEIKGINDLASLPNFNEILDRVEKGASLVDAYKMVNFDNFMQHTTDAARQQAINQMRGKAHLPSQSQSVATEGGDVDVPDEIMKRMKEDGKSEKQIRELYAKVAGKLHIG